MQGHHSSEPHTSCQVLAVVVVAYLLTLACYQCTSRVLIRRQFSLPAYTRIANFCHIFSCGNVGRLIHRTAYTRVYTVMPCNSMLICDDSRLGDDAINEQIMFKMDLNGNGSLVEQCHLNKALGLHSDSYTFDKFRYACILSGCDYVASLPGIGLAKATKVFRLSRQTDIAVVSERSLSPQLEHHLIIAGYCHRHIHKR